MFSKLGMVVLAAGLSANGIAQGPAQARPGVPPPKPSAAPLPQVTQAQAQPACVPPACTPPAAVVTPATPEQMAPVAPQVSYQNGQLSIMAQNSTLSSILSAVRARTGAQIDMPPDAANDRVAAQLGPGNPRDVIASLLEGSRFDYIVLGSPSDPDAVSRVILTPHAGSGAAPTTASMPQPSGGNVQPGMPPRPAGGAGRPEITGDEDEGAEVQAPPEPPQPVVPQPNPPGTAAAQGQQQNPNQVKTPQQLLQELQQMQQQQQGQQQPPRGHRQRQE